MRRPYPKYKSSGVEWLGDVPEHWETDRLKWSTGRTRNGIWGNEPDGENDIPCVRVADFNRVTFRAQMKEPTVRAITESERRGRLLKMGDLLLEKSGGGELQAVGTVVIFDHNISAVCSNFIARISVAQGFNGRYLLFLHAHLYASRVNTRSIKQTTGIQNLDSGAYFDERVGFPPLEEQHLIASFLDGQTGKIERLCERISDSIDKLHEYQTALISAAVTGKIDVRGEAR